jgi:hypothetical protein
VILEALLSLKICAHRQNISQGLFIGALARKILLIWSKSLIFHLRVGHHDDILGLALNLVVLTWSSDLSLDWTKGTRWHLRTSPSKGGCACMWRVNISRFRWTRGLVFKLHQSLVIHTCWKHPLMNNNTIQMTSNKTIVLIIDLIFEGLFLIFEDAL